MPRLKIGLFYVFAITLVCGVALGADFYVDAQGGSNSNNGRSPGSAWLNIGYALSKVRGTSSDPATIHVAAGTYSASTNGEPFPIRMKSYVSLLGANADTTILDAEGDAQLVIYYGYVSGVDLGSLTIKGGKTAEVGGGILCDSSDNITIMNCIVTENSGVMGAGLHLRASSGLISGCEIIGNAVDGETRADGVCGGAGMVLVNCSLDVDGCVIAENEAFGRRGGGAMGAGILVGNYAQSRDCMTDQMGYDTGQRGRDTVIGNCVISDNSCADDTNSRATGGGICLIDSSPSILNSLFIRNYAALSGGAFMIGASEAECSPEIVNCTVAGNSAGYGMGGAVCSYDATPTFRNCIVWGDGDTIDESGGELSLSYSCTQRGYWGVGNISDDPLFVTGPLGDYYLSCRAAGQGANSRCIDAGSDTAHALDLDKFTTRTDGVPDSGIVDMGYHYLLPAEENPTIECSLNDDEFSPGDLLVALYDIDNPGLDITVDVYFAFVMPDGAILCISPTRIDFGIFPCMTDLFLHQGYSMEPTSLLSVAVPGGLPVGNYLFAGALSEPGRFEVVGDISLFEFALRG